MAINKLIKEQGEFVKLADAVIRNDRWQNLEKKFEASTESVFKTKRQKEVLLKLLCALRTEYECIKHDYYHNQYTSRSLLAWRARNLLEINTWCRFCCDQPENAEIFFEDAGKDQLELEEQLEKWGKDTNQPPEWFENIIDNKKYIHEQAAKRGITELNSKYVSPSNAAKNLNHDKTFKIHNKILSKFVHPTAMLILSKETEKGLSQRAFYFFSQGCLFFYDGFCRLEKFLENNGQIN